jgi:hypothetical protein
MVLWLAYGCSTGMPGVGVLGGRSMILTGGSPRCGIGRDGVRHGIRARVRVGPRAGVGVMCMHGDGPRIWESSFVGDPDETVLCRKHRARRALPPGLASGYAGIRGVYPIAANNLAIHVTALVCSTS